MRIKCGICNTWVTLPDDTLDLVMLLDIEPMFFRCETCQKRKVVIDMSEILETGLTDVGSTVRKNLE